STPLLSLSKEMKLRIGPLPVEFSEKTQRNQQHIYKNSTNSINTSGNEKSQNNALYGVWISVVLFC
ncbi:hypothetical protein, partial [Neisseria maigaei]|uniref:hypothetical protein n=1 Tax=Neisseria maigaei TaxID=2830651 RepID=UPI002659D122